jgi:hypothetical protein
MEEKEKQVSPVANLSVFIGRNSESPSTIYWQFPKNVSYSSSNSVLQLLALFMPGKLLFMIQIAMSRLEQIASKLQFIAYYFIMEIFFFLTDFYII